MNIDILIVDDIEANLFSLEGLINELEIEEKQKINVMKSLSGEEALKIAMNNPLDLIILDVQMPIINGFEVAKFLKSNTKTKDIPIIFLTAAFISEEFVKNGFEVGAIDYFIKPVDKHIFLNKIKLYITLTLKSNLLESSEKQLKLLNTSLEQRVQEEVKKNQIKTQQLFAQSRLAQMGEMISMIAHQWRQPLNAISATAANLELTIYLKTFDLDTKEGQVEQNIYFIDQLKNIGNFALNLSKTIDDFRNFYTPNKKSIKTNYEKIMKKSMSILESSFVNDNIELICNYDSNEDIEMYDREMQQVVLNILKNAQDNFKENQIKNPKITITTTENTLSISDNGGGIPDGILEKIFDPYFSTKDEKNGTGLGLYMSKVIIEEHHKGQLNAININDGVCFIINLNKKEEIT